MLNNEKNIPRRCQIYYLGFLLITLIKICTIFRNFVFALNTFFWKSNIPSFISCEHECWASQWSKLFFIAQNMTKFPGLVKGEIFSSLFSEGSGWRCVFLFKNLFEWFSKAIFKTNSLSGQLFIFLISLNLIWVESLGVCFEVGGNYPLNPPQFKTC